jgi:hypothetical protein
MGMQKKRLQNVYLTLTAPIILTLATFCLVSCQRGIEISVGEEYPPRFLIRRHVSEVNEFPLLIVEEVSAQNTERPVAKRQNGSDRVLWKIVKEDNAVIHADTIGTIVYGEVPSGFVQRTPEQGLPPPLSEGKIYEASGSLIMMPEAIVRFTIRNNKTVKLPLPDD